jgi:hypothetical protein
VITDLRAGHEPNEVCLDTLPQGAEFEVQGHDGRVLKTGIMIEVNAGSVTVAMRSTKPPRVIATADGRTSRPIAVPDSIEHCAKESPVVPTGKVVDVQKWMDKLKGGNTMGTEPGSVKSKKEKKAAKAKEPKAPKLYVMIRYAVTAKAVPEKKDYMNEEKTSVAAVTYRFIEGCKEPPTFEEVLGAVRKQVKTETDAEGFTANMRWYINDLKKNGYIKSLESKEEAAA